MFNFKLNNKKLSLETEFFLDEIKVILQQIKKKKVFKTNQEPNHHIILSLPEILERCKDNDRRAQLKMYRKYCDGMYYVAFRFLKNSYDAEEAMQEGFVKAFAKMHQFNGEVTFGAWLKRIVINKSIDMLKAKKLELVALNEQTLGKADEFDDWSVEDGISLDQIKEAIDELPERYRYAVMLFLIEGYDHQEISDILEITEVASRTLVHRGKKKLQEKLKHVYHGTGY